MSYKDSLQLLRDTADMARTAWLQRNHVDRDLTQNAIGRIAATSSFSSDATPLHDTSAMYGFIIESSATIDASPTRPVTFRIEFGADASFLGYLDDELDELSQDFRQAEGSGNFDVLITTGAVSAGKFDLV
ncbi:hypothetical protein J3459_014771 [Metarhizium acridum]|nr:hypothetical protein J3459_014771 [Metarhizium acridum]